MKLLNIYNLLILNYGITWMLVATDVNNGIRFFIIIWGLLIIIKTFQLFFRKLIIGATILVLGAFFPILIPVLIFVPLILLFLLLIKAFKNWFLILVGSILYYMLFKIPPDMHDFYVSYSSESIAIIFSGITGVSIISASAFLLQKVGFEKKSVETVLLSLPLFVAAIFIGIALQDGEAFDN